MTNLPESLRNLDAWWRAANYVSVGQIYLFKNPLLQLPLRISDIKPRLVGHWGTTPGLNFIYAHLNRVIKLYDIDVLNITGPGHGGPAIVANAWLEGTYSELFPDIPQNLEGMEKLFRQFSFPGGISSHTGAETPGSIHEGGELGYSLSHAFGAAFDNPDLIVACVIGDGEAETGPLATSWHSNKFLNPVTDGAVLPILHLNGYKIAGPTLLARIPQDELTALMRGYGYHPYFVEGDDPSAMHRLMANTLEKVIAEIRNIQYLQRHHAQISTPNWPVIILRTPKGWTCPKMIDGLALEGTFRSHQVPIRDFSDEKNIRLLEDWLRSYRPHELFDAEGKLLPEIAELAPVGDKRMSANPIANGKIKLPELKLPDFRNYGIEVKAAGVIEAEATKVQAKYIRDIVSLNPTNFRIFSPDETNSNGWNAVFEVTNRCWVSRIEDDDHLARDGRVMEMLSEHQCEGWLEGYLLTGRHGFFSCYEAFVHIVDSMFNQHAKWLKVSAEVPWRQSIPSLNYLLSSHVWRQDHNGFSHQDPGFIDHVTNKKSSVIRVYLPPDANTLLSVTDHCLRSRNYVNLIVAGKQPELQWLGMDEAIEHCNAGVGIWEWASNTFGAEPDIVMACCGDVPTLETLAAVDLLLEFFPELKVRVVNVVDLMKLDSKIAHPHGLNDWEFDKIFTSSKPVIFAFHGYPSLIHRLTYHRNNHSNFHVHGYREEGCTTTAFDMVVRNQIDRFHLILNAIAHLPQLGPKANHIIKFIKDSLDEHRYFISKHGTDLPYVQNWRWNGRT